MAALTLLNPNPLSEQPIFALRPKHVTFSSNCKTIRVITKKYGRGGRTQAAAVAGRCARHGGARGGAASRGCPAKNRELAERSFPVRVHGRGACESDDGGRLCASAAAASQDVIHGGGKHAGASAAGVAARVLAASQHRAAAGARRLPQGLPRIGQYQNFVLSKRPDIKHRIVQVRDCATLGNQRYENEFHSTSNVKK